MKRRDPLSVTLRVFTYLAVIITMGSFLCLVGYILIKGIPNLRPSLFAWEYTSENCSMTPAIINTFIMTLMALLFAAPLGVFTAIFMIEYAKRGSLLVKIVRTAAETLAGIPSIVYGLFGFLFFLSKLGWGFSLLSGASTLAIMILPLIMRTAEEAIRSVPDSFREGSFGLGAGRLRTVFRIVLPAAMPGILSGIILATGRVVGETAALIYSAGTVAQIPSSVFSSVRTLSVHMYALSNEGLHMGEAFATAAVLLIMVALLNASSSKVAKKLAGGGNK